MLYLTRKIKGRIGAGLAALAFLLVFGGVGMIASWGIYATIRDGLRAKDWVAVQAEVQHVDMGTVTYHYEWQGKRYTSDRVGTFVFGGSTSDDWDDRMEKRIVAAQEKREPLMAWVNPANPSEAMLDREIRLKLLAICLPFAIGFGGAGIAAFILIGRDAIGWKETGGGVPLLKAQARQALFSWAICIAWNGVTMPLAFIGIPEMYRDGEWFGIVVVSVFPLVGLLILWGALGNTVQMIRAGNPFNARSSRDPRTAT